MSYYSPQQPPVPYITQQEFQQRQDEDNLRLLSIFHYVLGGLTIFGSSIFLLHFGMGLAMLVNPSWMQGAHDDAPPAFMGWIFTLLGGGAVLAGWTLGGLTIHAGRCLTRRTGYNLAFVLACLNCLHAPIGTALGVFTILVLSRPSVKALFGLPVPPALYPSFPDNEMSSTRPWYRGQ